MIQCETLRYPACGGHREARRLYLYAPVEAYPGERFPVLYMFDGHNVFFDEDATYGKSWGMLQYLESTGLPLAVAALECNHGEHNERLQEYTPWPFSDPHFGNIPAFGEDTLHYFTTTLRRRVERELPILRGREHTFIAGSSMGGLMSLAALLRCPEVYGGAAALSPSLWVAPGELMQLIRSAQLPGDTLLYLSAGEKELGKSKRARHLFGRVCLAMTDLGISTCARVVPDGAHCEACWEKEIPQMMETLLWRHSM